MNVNPVGMNVNSSPSDGVASFMIVIFAFCVLVNVHSMFSPAASCTVAVPAPLLVLIIELVAPTQLMLKTNPATGVSVAV